MSKGWKGMVREPTLAPKEIIFVIQQCIFKKSFLEVVDKFLNTLFDHICALLILPNYDLKKHNIGRKLAFYTRLF